MAWPTDITAMEKGRVLEVAFDDGEVIRLSRREAARREPKR